MTRWAGREPLRERLMWRAIGMMVHVEDAAARLRERIHVVLDDLRPGRS